MCTTTKSLKQQTKQYTEELFSPIKLQKVKKNIMKIHCWSAYGEADTLSTVLVETEPDTVFLADNSF